MSSECKEMIIEILSLPEGDVFIESKWLDEIDDNNPNLINTIKSIKDKYAFATIFKNTITGILEMNMDWFRESGINESTLYNRINDKFMWKYMAVITWCWELILRLNLWEPIKFIASIIGMIVSLKKTSKD